MADDSHQATVLRPVINVCVCRNLGQCTTVNKNDLSTNANTTGERFRLLPCACPDGYTGALCEQDLDACEENFQPCYPGVQCTDLPPPANQSGFKCASCPSGSTGNGVECKGMRYSSK